MPLDRREWEIRSELLAVWVAPGGTPFPEPGTYMDEPWDLAHPAVEIPDAPPEDLADGG